MKPFCEGMALALRYLAVFAFLVVLARGQIDIGGTVSGNETVELGDISTEPSVVEQNVATDAGSVARNLLALAVCSLLALIV